MKKYNENRPHSGKYCYGKTPMQTFLQSKCLADEKNLDKLNDIQQTNLQLDKFDEVALASSSNFVSNAPSEEINKGLIAQGASRYEAKKGSDLSNNFM